MATRIHSLSVLSDGSLQESTSVPAQLWRIKRDEELAEFNYMSRTGAETWTLNPQTPSVFRFYPLMKEGAGDFRVHMSPLATALFALNGENSLADPKTSYLVADNSGLYNNTGWDLQAYISTSDNLLKGSLINGWLEFETLTNGSDVTGMTHATHPHLVHSFDIVGITSLGVTYHTIPPPGVIYYYLTTNEGKAYIQEKYVERI